MEANGRVWQSPGSCVITNDPCPHWFPGHWAFKSVNNIANCVSTLPNAIDFLDLRSPGQMSQTRFSQPLLILCMSILFTIFVSFTVTLPCATLSYVHISSKIHHRGQVPQMCNEKDTLYFVLVRKLTATYSMMRI